MNIWDNLDFLSRCICSFPLYGESMEDVFFCLGGRFHLESQTGTLRTSSEMGCGCPRSSQLLGVTCVVLHTPSCIRESSMSPCFARWMRHAVSTFASAIAVAWIYKHVLLGSSTFFCLCNICNSSSPVHWGIHTKLCITCLQSIRQ